MQTRTRMMTKGRVALGLAALMVAGAAQAQTNVSAVIGADSSDGVTLYGDFTATFGNGFYAGWDVSSSLATIGDVENELYLGFGFGETFTFDIGAAYHWVLSDSSANGFEAYAGVGWGPLSLDVTYALEDRTGVDSGDIGIELGADFSLGLGFGLGLTAGYDIPKNSDSNFTGVDVELSYAIYNTPATIFTTYSFVNDGSDTIVIGLDYAFDIW